MSFKTSKEFTKKNQAMEKTPSSCAVDKYMSKSSKILTCSKKFKIIVLVAEVWCVNYFFLAVFSLYLNMCLNIKMHNIKRPELFRVTFKFCEHQFTLGFHRCYYFQLQISFFFAFGPSSGLLVVFLVAARLILKTPPVI